MKYIYWKVFIVLAFTPVFLFGQNVKNQVRGTVSQIEEDGSSTPLIGVNVYWADGTSGTSSDVDGRFIIEETASTDLLVFSYVGFQTDTVQIVDDTYLEITLNSDVLLDEVEVVRRKKSTEISYLDPLKVEKIGEKELLKAACCNLSESFETSASVDVSFTDAITGTRQIQMLGLTGPYTQINFENMPNIRGFSTMFGMEFVPGAWIESIQLNKGTGSVLNGYEAIAGQINYELRKPESADPFYLNIYGNEGGRVEVNAHWAKPVGSKWSTALLVHGKNNTTRWDRNSDGFMDHPLNQNLIALNRWKYIGDDGWRVQLGLKGTLFNITGGQIDFDPDEEGATPVNWGLDLNIKRLDGFAKIGKAYIEKPYKSVAFQMTGAIHEQESIYGLRPYDAKQRSFYGNFIYQSIFDNTNHTFRTGMSFQYDDYDERLRGQLYEREEIVPGAYFEYTYTHLEKFSAVVGLRYDYHNLFGGFVTPRLHLRYAPHENSVFRASAGRGQRTANILSENNGLLASARQVVIDGEKDSDKPYGLDPEVAWNFGLNFTQSFRLDYRDGNVSLDFYHTDFKNQIVVDLDKNPQQVNFYNLQGRSYSNSFQAQVNYEIIKRLEGRIAYRLFDVKTDYTDELLEKPLVARHRAFINLGYSSRNNWHLDATVNWLGSKRIPSTTSNPEPYQLDERSPDFVTVNTQISKTWNENLELYVGAENLLNFRQEKAILSSENPFGKYFDSSMVWGPIFGRNIYFGLRYKVIK